MPFLDKKLSVWYVLVFATALGQDVTDCVADSDRCMHPDLSKQQSSHINPQELDKEYWRANAREYLKNKLKTETAYNENKAKNIIFFLGDGMSMATTAATRVYSGGEELALSFEDFPHFGLAKTYCVNRQVPDSACTSTAFLHGVKANYGTVGLNAYAPRYDCDAFSDKTKHTESFTKWAQDSCKATGYVTTTRVTHATVAAVFAHSANRYWENDGEVLDRCEPDTDTVDIARQLLENDVGSKLKVVLGGGRNEFRDFTMIDEEGAPGYRTDGRDLIAKWQADRSQDGNATFVWNEQLLKSLDYDNTDFLLGLFESDHCLYNVDIERKGLTESEPSLTEMTEAAIRMLQKEENGYFLFVEGGRIDTAHHDTFTHMALGETKELGNAIGMARRMTNESDTLIIVTSDHAHVLSFNGYSARGHDVLGLNEHIGTDGKPYSTLSYANGMGYFNTYEDGERRDLSQVDFTDPDLQYMSMVPRDAETHGGDDVGVYASGPWSHLFIGNYEQNIIPLALAYAAKIGPYADATIEVRCSAATILVHVPLALMVVVVLLVRLY